MKDKKTIFDYLGSLFCRFGITMMLLTILCMIFGEDAKELSNMFQFGSKGIPVSTMFQFFGVTIISEVTQYLFMSDKLIKNMPELFRDGCYVAVVVVVILISSYLFGWFPINMWQAWVMFILCFGLCFGVSVRLAVIKTKMENRKLEEGLSKLKENWEKEKRDEE